MPTIQGEVTTLKNKQNGIKFLEFWRKEDLVDYFNKNYNNV